MCVCITCSMKKCSDLLLSHPTFYCLFYTFIKKYWLEPTKMVLKLTDHIFFDYL